MMKKKYITPAIQVFPLKIQLYLQAYSVKDYEPVEEPIIIGDNDED
jgi:hypothetical protein